MTNKEFMKYFDFDESDLNSNRGGSLSPKQTARLIQSDRSARRIFLIIGLVSTGLAVLPTMILWFIGKLNSVGWYSLFWMIPFGLLGLFFIRAGLKTTTYMLKKAAGEVEIAKGGSYNDPAGIFYELRIGDKQFGISEKLADRLNKESEKNYTVYYYWGSDTVETDLMDSHIMSLEKVQ